MRDGIREAAEKNGRSMSAEIIHRLQRTFDQNDHSGFMIGNLSEEEIDAIEQEKHIHQASIDATRSVLKT